MIPCRRIFFMINTAFDISEEHTTSHRCLQSTESPTIFARAFVWRESRDNIYKFHECLCHHTLLHNTWSWRQKIDYVEGASTVTYHAVGSQYFSHHRPFRGESTIYRWLLFSQRDSDTELWCFFVVSLRSCWTNTSVAGYLRCHGNVWAKLYT